MSSNIALILSLVDAQRSPKTGSKAANLSKLITARFPVPKGFVISADAYRSHLWASGARAYTSAAADVETREKIREAILSSPIPADVWSAITDAYKRLSWQLGIEKPKVAVRASAIEDSSDVSFTGAYESVLNVLGLDALNVAIKRVWASLWNGKAAAYRAKQQIDSEPAMAIIIQEMLDADWHGTAFTADPVTGNPHSVLISCDRIENAGECDTAMGMPQYIVDLRRLSQVNCACELEDPLRREILSLISERSVLIEKIISSPADVEWAYDGEKVWFLQARPITNLPVYFPVVLGDEPGVNAQWQRISSYPVSYFIRSCLWKSPSSITDRFPGRCADESRLINGFVYRRALDIPTDKAAKRNKDCAVGLRLLAQWRKGIGPGLRKRAASVISINFAQAEYSVLVGALNEAVEITRIAADWLDAARYPSVLFAQLLEQMLQDKEVDQSLYRKLLCGLSDPTVMRDAKLQELGERFAIADGLGKANDREWWLSYKKDVDRFAREYGYSFKDAGEMCDIALWESWIENTDPVFRAIGAIARRDKRPSLLTRHCASEQAAAGAASEAEVYFKGGQRAHFKTISELARGWLAAANEIEHVYALACTALRLALMEIGDRLCESQLISEIDDIFYLTLDEITALPAQPSETDRAAVAGAIANRRHEIWLEQRLTAPDVLNCDSNYSKTEPLAQTSNGLIAGKGVSPGTAAGCVRIARNIADAGEIENGDILIVDSPGLAWTPFLALAGGFISEQDINCPSEAAIICEYEIPVITNCKGVLAAVKNGQRITIDGTNGTVELKGSS